MKVFLDTNIYMHCKPIEELDLLTLLKADEITVVIPQIVVRELDKQKDTNQNSKIRSRVKSTLKNIKNWHKENGSMISENVYVVCDLKGYSRPECEEYHLDYDSQDHRLILAMIKYKEQFPDERIVLISNDITPRLMASEYGCEEFEPTEDMMMNPEVDPDKKEIRRLKAELDKYQSAVPNISVGFKHGNNQLKNYIEAELGEFIIEEEAFQSCVASKKEHMFDNSVFMGMRVDNFPFPGLIDDDLLRYKSHLREAYNIIRQSKRSVLFCLSVSNTGNKPAENISLQLVFPKHITVVECDYFIKEMPRFSGDSHKDLFGVDYDNIFDTAQETSLGCLEIKKETLTGEINKIQHGSVYQVNLVAIVDIGHPLESFSCNYRFQPDNTPMPTEGKLYFKISDKNTMGSL